jgi:hypothetical protein
MSNMKKFHEMLSTSSGSQDSYLQALKAFTKISPSQLAAMTSDLGWQAW